MVEGGKEYKITVNYGGKDGKTISCYYQLSSAEAETACGKAKNTKKGILECKLEAYNRDVYHSVTTDTEKVYAKLVNAEDFDKRVLVNLENLNVKAKAELVVLTGDAELVHTSNVNTREAELVKPVNKKISVKKSKVGKQLLELVLPANSVSVVILEKE